MQIKISDKEAMALLSLRAFIRTRPTSPSDFMSWLRDRLIYQYDESENVDFVRAVNEYSIMFRDISLLLDETVSDGD